MHGHDGPCWVTIDGKRQPHLIPPWTALPAGWRRCLCTGYAGAKQPAPPSLLEDETAMVLDDEIGDDEIDPSEIQ